MSKNDAYALAAVAFFFGYLIAQERTVQAYNAARATQENPLGWNGAAGWNIGAYTY